jgi:hypothetical protein
MKPRPLRAFHRAHGELLVLLDLSPLSPVLWFILSPTTTAGRRSCSPLPMLRRPYFDGASTFGFASTQWS